MRAINERGLQLPGTVQAPRRRGIQACSDGAQIPPCQLGIVATKSLHTDAALAATAGAFADAAVCSVQNGVGNEEIIARYVPRVIRGTTIVAGHVPAPGVVHLDAPGDTWIGPFEPQPARMDEVRQLAGLLTRGGLPTTALADARGAQWTKLIFNSATSPVAALTGLTMGAARRDGRRPRADRAGWRPRAARWPGALGITLDDDPLALIDEAVTHASRAPAQHAAGRAGPAAHRDRRPQRRHRPAGPGRGRPRAPQPGRHRPDPRPGALLAVGRPGLA